MHVGLCLGRPPHYTVYIIYIILSQSPIILTTNLLSLSMFYQNNISNFQDIQIMSSFF